MSTRSSIFYGDDDKGANLHIYWEYIDQCYWMEVTRDGYEYDEIEVPRRLIEALGHDPDRKDVWDTSVIDELSTAHSEEPKP